MLNPYTTLIHLIMVTQIVQILARETIPPSYEDGLIFSFAKRERMDTRFSVPVFQAKSGMRSNYGPNLGLRDQKFQIMCFSSTDPQA